MEMKGLCAPCENRKTCIKLCPEAEVYADQDRVGAYNALLLENIYSTGSGMDDPWRQEREDPRDLSKIQAVELLVMSKSRREVARELGIPRETIRRWLK